MIELQIIVAVFFLPLVLLLAGVVVCGILQITFVSWLLLLSICGSKWAMNKLENI